MNPASPQRLKEIEAHKLLLRIELAHWGELTIKLVECRPLVNCFVIDVPGDEKLYFAKVLKNQTGLLPRNFSREVEIQKLASQKISCPKILHYAKGQGWQFFVSQYQNLPRLDRVFLRSAPNDEEIAISLALRISGWVHKLHLLNIVHRDLASDHIFFRLDGSISIVDFGMAKLIPSNRENFWPLFGYDIVSTGLILIEVLLGRKIFSRRSSLLYSEIIGAWSELAKKNSSKLNGFLLECVSTTSEFDIGDAAPGKGFVSSNEFFRASRTI